MIAIIYLEPGIPSNRISSVCDDYVPAPCTHRPSLLPIECFSEVLGLPSWRLTLPRWRKDDQTVALRGSKSRNKVSVGEPAEGSLQEFGPPCLNTLFFPGLVGCREAPPSPRTLGLSALWLLRPGPLVRDPFWARAYRGPSRPAGPWCRNRPSRSSRQGLLGLCLPPPGLAHL